MLTAEDISYRVNVANIKMAVCTPNSETIEHLLTAANRENSLKTVFVAREDFDGTVNITKEIEDASDELERVETKADEPMLIYFTSGTTGYPKAVVHNHIYSLCHIISAKYWQNVKRADCIFQLPKQAGQRRHTEKSTVSGFAVVRLWLLISINFLRQKF